MSLRSDLHDLQNGLCALTPPQLVSLSDHFVTPVSQGQTTTVLLFRRRCVVLKWSLSSPRWSLSGPEISGPENDQIVVWSWSLSGPVTPVTEPIHVKLTWVDR